MCCWHICGWWLTTRSVCHAQLWVIYPRQHTIRSVCQAQSSNPDNIPSGQYARHSYLSQTTYHEVSVPVTVIYQRHHTTRSVWQAQLSTKGTIPPGPCDRHSYLPKAKHVVLLCFKFPKTFRPYGVVSRFLTAIGRNISGLFYRHFPGHFRCQIVLPPKYFGELFSVWKVQPVTSTIGVPRSNH